MALWHCLACTTAYAVGLVCCPHCRSTSKEEDGVMPKITKAGGPSIEGAVPADEPVPNMSADIPAPEPAAEPEPEPEPKPRKRNTVARAQVAEGKGVANA